MNHRVFALLLPVMVAACAPVPSTAPKNVVLITMDTTRADRLGCYGYDGVSTPNIDRVANRGTLFTRAFATAPITGPSHASILSGTYPPFHQVRDNAVSAVPEEIPWMPEIFRSQGYLTAGIVAAYPVKAAFGFGRGFDYFSDVMEAPPGSVFITNLHTVGVASRKGEVVAKEFELWLERRADGPFFAWVHFYDPHWPWEAGAGFADIYPEEPYDAEIAYMDDSIGTVLDALADAGLEDDTAVVLVADHGESLMDHGELTHALLVYNATIRVPLVVSIPWIEHVSTVSEPVSTVDILPTVLDVLGLDPGPTGEAIQGQSLRPLLGGQSAAAGTADRALYFETFYPYFHYGWGVLTGIVEGGWKYIKGPDDELYDLTIDFAEKSPVDEPDTRRRMADRLAGVTTELKAGRPDRQNLELDRQALDMLRSLGYMGGQDIPAADDLPNLEDLPIPRESMAAYFKHNEVLSLLRAKRYEEAATLCRQIAEENPSHKDARLLLINIHGQLQNRDEVGRLFDEVLVDFRDADVLYQAGLYHLSLADFDRARSLFEEVLTRDPADYEALTALGIVDAEQGELDGARRHFEAALAIEPKHRQALLRLGAVLDQLGDPASRVTFERAITAYPFDPEVNFNYGVYLFRAGDRDRALDYLTQASALASGSLFEPAHFALATYYSRTGDLEKARRYLREVVLYTNSPESLHRAQSMLTALE